MGALTRDARADDRVAEKMPAVMRGPKPDTMLITIKKKKKSDLHLDTFLITDPFKYSTYSFSWS